MIDSEKWLHLATHIPDATWTLVRTEHRGRALRALRSIRVDELLFEESPLLLGPIGSDDRSVNNCVACRRLVANSTRSTCARGCGLPLCAVDCPQANRHDAECERIRSWRPRYDSATVNRKVLAILAAIRGLSLPSDTMWLLDNLQANRMETLEKSVTAACDEFHEVAPEVVAFLRRTVSVLNTNAFQAVGGWSSECGMKGLYALAGQLNHNCVPNTRHSFDETNYRIRVHASRDIAAGEEITTSYTSLLWDTPTRRIHLHRTKQFWCDCARCADPTEAGTYLAALRCMGNSTPTLCPGRVLPKHPLDVISEWKCDTCSRSLEFSKVRQVQTITNSVLQKLVQSTDSADIWSCPANHRILERLVWPFNKSMIEAKLQRLWNDPCGSSRNVALLAEQFCVDVLELIDRLGAGECTLKQLVSCELCQLRSHLLQPEAEK